MSAQAFGWVLDHSPAEGSARLVLLSIANHAGDLVTDDAGVPAWEAWPGIATMQREARLKRSRTVTDAITKLVNDGLLVRIVNGAPDKRIPPDKRPNLYRVLLTGVSCDVTRCRWCGVSESDAPGCRDATAPGVVSRRSGVSQNDTQTVIDPPGEPSENPGQQLALVVADAGEPRWTFDAFWSAYPRRVAKAAAEKAWKAALNHAAPSLIVAGAARYASEVADRTPDKIAHPATWLNGRRWEDPPGANASGRTPARGATAPVTADRSRPAGRVQM